jgi:hypothetical protein
VTSVRTGTFDTHRTAQRKQMGQAGSMLVIVLSATDLSVDDSQERYRTTPKEVAVKPLL